MFNTKCQAHYFRIYGKGDALDLEAIKSHVKSCLCNHAKEAHKRRTGFFGQFSSASKVQEDENILALAYAKEVTLTSYYCEYHDSSSFAPHLTMFEILKYELAQPGVATRKVTLTLNFLINKGHIIEAYKKAMVCHDEVIQHIYV